MTILLQSLEIEKDAILDAISSFFLFFQTLCTFDGMELIFCSFFLHFQTFLNKAEHISVGNLCCFGSFNWRQEPNRKLQCLLYCQWESALEIMELSKTSSFHDQMCRKSRISQIYQCKNWPIRVKNMGGIYCFYRFVW